MDDYFKAAKQIIDQDNIRIVSFDLFDTLFVRPALSGDDILRLFSKTIEKEYNLNVEQERLSAVKKLQNPYASSSAIWRYIAAQLGFSIELAELFAQKEFEFEKNLICQRKLGKRIFDYAVLKGKKIIAVSDMHFSKAQLMEMLYKCNYYDVSDVYVSCERSAVKRTGDLFDVVLACEKECKPDNILHIGDSHKADYIAPKSKGLKTFFIPKNTVLFREYFDAHKLLNNLGDDIYGNIIIGFAINQLLEHPEETGVNFTLQTYIHLIIFPMLLHTSLFLLNEPDIQMSKKYRKLYFASRDGYLTKKAYDLLCPFFESKLESCYLLTSRIACRTMTEDSFFERLYARFIPQDCTLAEFVTATVTDSSLRELILLELDDESRNTLIRPKTQQCITLLSHYAEALENHHNEKKQATFAYYSNMFEDATSVLMVDCGFCGTISAYLTRAFHGDKKFDKAFFWENEKNQMLDDINGTKTYTAFSSKKGHLLGPQVESMFSEISGSCLGFSLSLNGTPIPIFENNWQPEEMKSDILFVQQYALDLVQKFCDTFEVFLPLLMPTNLQIVMDFILHFLSGSNLNAPTIFHNILFKESYSSRIKSKSLSELIICRNTKGE